MNETPSRPGQVALKAYRDQRYGFSLPYPETWYRFELQVEGGGGVLFAPSSDDVTTSLSVEVRDLGTTVTAEDLPDLRDGFLAGLKKVRGSKIESHQEYDVGFLIGLEAQQSFREGGARRKRWIRLLYKDSLQVRLVAQGATVEDFDYWRPVFAPAMTSFVFGELWPEPSEAERARETGPG